MAQELKILITAETGKAESNVKKLDKSIVSLGDASDKGAKKVTKELDNVANEGNKASLSIKNLATKLFNIPLTPLLAAAAALTAIVKVIGEVDSSMADLANMTGATGEELEKLYDVVGEVAKKTGISFDEATTIVGLLTQKLELTNEELLSLSLTFGKYAEVVDGGVDLISSIIDMTKRWGIANEDIGATLDMLVATTQDFGISQSELISILSGNKGLFDQLNLSLNEAIGLIASLAGGGYNVESMINSLNTAIRALAKDGEDARTTLQSLFDKVQNGTLTVEENALLVDLLGKNYAELMAAIKDGSLTFNDLDKILDDTTGRLDETASSYKSIADSIQNIFDSLGASIAPLVSTLSDVIATISEIISPVIELIMDFANALIGPALNSVNSIIGALQPLFDMLELVGELFISIGSIIEETVKPFLDSFSNSVQILGSVIGEVLIVVLESLFGILGTLSPVIEAMSYAFDFLGRTLETVCLIIEATFYSLLGLFYALTFQWGKAGDAFEDAGKSIAGIDDVWTREWGGSTPEPPPTPDPTDPTPDPTDPTPDPTPEEKPKQNSSMSGGYGEGELSKSDYLWDNIDNTVNNVEGDLIKSATAMTPAYEITTDITLNLDGEQLTNVVVKNLDGAINLIQPSVKGA